MPVRRLSFLRKNQIHHKRMTTGMTLDPILLSQIVMSEVSTSNSKSRTGTYW